LQVKISVTEQSMNKKFCVLLQKSPAETLTMLQQAYGDKAMKTSQVYEQHKCFHDECRSVHDDPRSDCLSASTNEANVQQPYSCWQKCIVAEGNVA
jgi:hypothetical protein